MKLLIIGASRGIGAVLLRQALAHGHEVTVLARQPKKIKVQHPRLQLLSGDIRDPLAVAMAVKGQEAVCVTIGIPITFQPVRVFSEGIEQVITTMQDLEVRRLICVTGIGAGSSKGHGGWLYDAIFKPLFLKTIYEDKDLQEDLIKQSDREWLIVRPAGLTNGPQTGNYRIITDYRGVTARRISRADVADFIIKELDVPRYTGQTPLLTY